MTKATDEKTEQASFLAMISHEIRTPMQAVYGILELIGEETKEQRILDLLKTAKTSASGLLEILDDVLDLAKMDAMKFDLDDFEVPVRMLARGVNEALEIKLINKPVALKDEIASDVPFVIHGDPKRLRQILMNLVGNAVKFTAKGSVTIKINADTQHLDREKHKTALRWEVVDTGIGIPDAVRGKLFQAFEQADGSTQRKYGGTGLGLSICKKLVELMDGMIGVDSVEDKGSTFWFEIPVTAVTSETSMDSLPSLENVSVLVIEDHPLGAKEIVKTLQARGANVERGSTVAEGMAAIESRPFDIVMADQGLPDGEGLTLLKETAQKRPTAGLIMYTARDDYGLQYSLKILGATYMTKPASRKGLVEAVHAAAHERDYQNPMHSTKLLIAEDTDSVRDILQRQLERLNVDVTFAENGAKAASLMQKNTYGLVITDLHMPDMDGYALAAKIRHNEKEGVDVRQPLVVMTADVQLSQPNVFRAHGFDECLLKPASLGQLRRLLIRWGITDDVQAPLPEQVTSNENQQIKTPEDDRPATLGDAINLESLQKQMGALDESAADMMEMFVMMTEPMMSKLEQAKEQKNNKELLELGHSLKGSARSASCMRLGDLAANLQDVASDGEDGSKLVDDIHVEFKRVKAEVKLLQDQFSK